MNAHPCRSKIVICIDANNNMIEFPSARNASKKIGVNPSNIINCCNGKQKTCKGMKFYYKIDATELNIY